MAKRGRRKAEPMPAPDEPVELPATFADERNRTWRVRLSIPLVLEFCDQHDIPLRRFEPAGLNLRQLFELAYRGTRWETKAKSAPESLEEFAESIGESAFYPALHAAANEVVNFTLRSSLPKSKLAEGVNMVRTVASAELKRMTEVAGAAGSSAGSAER